MATPLRVLVVEDSDDDAQLVLVKLRRAGYDTEFIRVDSEADFNAALAGKDWQIVVSDYSMPGFSGLKALQLLRAHSRDTPFILVSGTVGEEIAVEAMRGGANDYIMKDNLAGKRNPGTGWRYRPPATPDICPIHLPLAEAPFQRRRQYRYGSDSP